MIELKPKNTIDFFKNAVKEVTISNERKELLTSIALKIVEERHKLNKVRLNFICTHNSRRSQFAQIWAHFIIQQFKLRKIKSFSGGTETTAFHHNTIKSLQSAGFKFKLIEFSHTNPKYEITCAKMKKAAIGYSKFFNESTKNKSFIAITTCSSADENCPFIPEAISRFHLPYIDPKQSDNAEHTEETYLLTNKIIAAEMNFLFEQVNNLL